MSSVEYFFLKESSSLGEKIEFRALGPLNLALSVCALNYHFIKVFLTMCLQGTLRLIKG